jgi:hypothetical protein
VRVGLFLFVVACGIALVGTACAGDVAEQLTHYRVTLTGGEQVHVYKGTITEHRIEGETKLGDRLWLKRDDVSLVEVSAGNRSRDAGLIGGGLGLFAAAFIKEKDDSSDDRTGSSMKHFALYGFGGMIVGAIIGTQITVWRDIPFHAAFQINPESRTARLGLTLIL